MLVRINKQRNKKQIGYTKENKKNKEIKKNAAELNDETLENVSGGTRDAEANLENEYIKEETMLIIPII